MNKIAITIDVDWTLDEVIAKIAILLIKYTLKATWFVTHNSLEIQKLKKYPELFELGMHPNFAENSTQGENFKEIMNFLFKIVPGAKSARMHGLIQSTDLLRRMIEDYDIRYDVSLFLPRTANIVPHKIFISKNKSLLRIPYFWEDDEELNRPTPILTIKHSCYHQLGLKIFNFHPIHIFLNSRDPDDYKKIKRGINYPQVSFKRLGSFTYEGKGVGSFFEEVLCFISKNNLKSYTISDLALESKKENDKQ